MTDILLLWAVSLLIFALFVLLAKRKRTPRFEPNPATVTVSEWLRIIEEDSKYGVQ